MMINKQLAAIFDMDGVVVDDMEYHARAWLVFAKKRKISLTRHMVLQYFNGRKNEEILEFLFKRKVSRAEVKKWAGEKERLFRKIYAPHIRPVAGLPEFLKLLNDHSIKIALATAAPPENASFIIRKTKLSKYFKIIVNATHAKLGKPHPEIFLNAAKKLKVPPSRCVVFEDAHNGIEAARRAKMKVIGVATTHLRHELVKADLVIKNFKQINVPKIAKLLNI